MEKQLYPGCPIVGLIDNEWVGGEAFFNTDSKTYSIALKDGVIDKLPKFWWFRDEILDGCFVKDLASEPLTDLVKLILKDFPYIDITSSNNIDLNVSIGDMYDRPPLNKDTLYNLAVLFGAKDITNDNMGYSGCESCDYGSNYGYDIILKNCDKYNGYHFAQDKR